METLLTILVVVVAALLLIALGRGLLWAIEAVVGSRRASHAEALRGRLRVFGWFLVVLSVWPIIILFAAAAAQLWSPGPRGLDSEKWLIAIVSFVPAVIVALLVALPGILLISVASNIGNDRLSGPEFYLDSRLDGLMILGWFYTIAGLFVLTSGLAIPIGIAMGIVAFRRRQSSRDALLWSLALAAHRQMPLGPAVAAFAEQCRGRYRRRGLALSEFLESGASLPEALDRVPNLLPEAGDVAVRVGWENGVLARALRDAAVLRTHQPPPWQAVQGRLLYLILVLTAIQSVTGFVLYFIIPKFKKIFMDFGVELPKLTILVLNVSDFVVDYYFLVVPPLEILLAYLFVISFGGRTWAPSFLRRLFVRIDTAQILRALAVTMEGGLPLTAGLRALAKTYPHGAIRGELQRVHDSVTGGADWCASLGSVGLLSTIDGAVLESAQRVGNLPWAMREMAQSGERRLSYRLQVLVQIVFPIIVLCIGILVFFIASGIFLPLVKLISELSG